MKMTRPSVRFVALALALSLSTACGSTTRVATPAARLSAAGSQDSPALVRNFAAHLPIGTSVSIGLVNGTQLSGTLMEVQEAAVVVKRRTRIPEPARTVAYADIVTIEPQSSGGNTVKAVVLGAAAGAAAVFGVLLILIAHSG
jgi:hypothetical protein